MALCIPSFSVLKSVVSWWCGPHAVVTTYPIIYTAGYRFTGSNEDAFVVKLD